MKANKYNSGDIEIKCLNGTLKYYSEKFLKNLGHIPILKLNEHTSDVSQVLSFMDGNAIKWNIGIYNICIIWKYEKFRKIIYDAVNRLSNLPDTYNIMNKRMEAVKIILKTHEQNCENIRPAVFSILKTRQWTNTNEFENMASLCVKAVDNLKNIDPNHPALAEFNKYMSKTSVLEPPRTSNNRRFYIIVPRPFQNKI